MPIPGDLVVERIGVIKGLFVCVDPCAAASP